MYEVTHDRFAAGCGEQLSNVLKPHRRVLLYVGFPDKAEGFYEMVVRELASIGSVVEEASFGPLSRLAVIELDATRRAPAADCVVVYPIRRW
jgi:hypothetical protein